jgi:hypothetical protein
MKAYRLKKDFNVFNSAIADELINIFNEKYDFSKIKEGSSRHKESIKCLHDWRKRLSNTPHIVAKKDDVLLRSAWWEAKGEKCLYPASIDFNEK